MVSLLPVPAVRTHLRLHSAEADLKQQMSLAPIRFPWHRSVQRFLLSNWTLARSSSLACDV